ncbi:Colicin V production protein [Bibersteinia trehalosi USDA-ARS-USMARC-190]|uniref:Colicin V production protein n=1 Tax=Bibersteinia trehalosi USDA-ARS-USMARC-190 TaxID=1263832 RepID=W0R518_BIBTR|nr:CvpA family protein [Bibersteinia trehalosi]AHG86214.1 Colicin V production protein [Bibersteinia trehalosi USDA-ARS-USMARC-190]
MVDAIIIGIIVFSLMVSLWRGFIREVLSLVGWVVAFFIASKFYPNLSAVLLGLDSPYLQNEYLRNGIAAAILFIAVLIMSGIVNTLLSQLADKTGLTGTDRVLGAAFGVLRGVFIVAGLLFFIGRFTSFDQSDLWKESQLIPHFDFIVAWFFEQLEANKHLIQS